VADWYEESAKAHEHYNRRLQAIRSNRNLSPEGKRAAIATEWVKARATVEQSRATVEAAKADERRMLEHDLFGVGTKDPAAVIAHRDAGDRAEAVESPAEAVGLLARASRSGDKALGRAILRVALDRGWMRVAEEWIAENPVWAHDVRPLLQERMASRGARARAVLADSMFATVAKPLELNTLSDADLERLAQE
jgi:hypothetical protein